MLGEKPGPDACAAPKGGAHPQGLCVPQSRMREQGAGHAEHSASAGGGCISRHFYTELWVDCAVAVGISLLFFCLPSWCKSAVLREKGRITSYPIPPRLG